MEWLESTKLLIASSEKVGDSKVKGIDSNVKRKEY